MHSFIFKSAGHPLRLKLSTLTIIVTDRCNYRCSYCYQKKTNRELDLETVKKAIDFIHPRLTRECYVNFYGGEPLIAFDLIRKSVAHLERLNRRRNLKIRYAVSTNGSLLSGEILRFLEEHSFFVLLSFDGGAQDAGRKKGSFDRLVSLIPEILKRKRISLETNSVFTSDTIGHLSESILLLRRLGVPTIHIGFSLRRRWTPVSLRRWRKEMAAIRAHFLDAYERAKDVPWTEMAARPQGIYRCDAGREQMALAADGRLWGCFLFPYYFDGNGRDGEGGQYCFGHVDAFFREPEAQYARVMTAISGLSMIRARTPEKRCLMCEDIQSCWVCPVAAAFSSQKLGAISRQTCRMTRMMNEEKDLLSAAFEDKKGAPNPRLTASGAS